jgi:hypothetical protein
MNKDKRFWLGTSFALIGLLVFSVWWHSTIWYECRAEHSWMYCYQLVFMSGR